MRMLAYVRGRGITNQRMDIYNAEEKSRQMIYDAGTKRIAGDLAAQAGIQQAQAAGVNADAYVRRAKAAAFSGVAGAAGPAMTLLERFNSGGSDYTGTPGMEGGQVTYALPPDQQTNNGGTFYGGDE